MRKPWRVAGLMTVVLLGLLAPRVSAAARTYETHPGYLASTKGEREQVTQDMVVLMPPPADGLALRERIFNERLSREFTEKYYEKFGRTEQQRAYLAPNHHTYYNDMFTYNGTQQQTDEERRRFGEYMLRRLTEYHVEHYAKSDPKVRPMWEAKERLSQMDVRVGKRVKFKAKYSIASNSADFNMENPWADSKVTLQLGSGIREAIFSLSRPVTKTISAETHWATKDGVLSIIGRKSLSERLGATVTTSTFTNHTGKSRRESLYMAGFSYVY